MKKGNNDNFVINYDSQSSGAFITNQDGVVATREEANNIFNLLQATFDFYGDEWLKRHSKDVDDVNNGPDGPDNGYNFFKSKTATKKGWVYVLQGGGLCKIGMTARLPSRRIAEYSPKLPFKTSIVASFRVGDPRGAEASIHWMMSSKRIRGEWFNLNDSDIEGIKCFGLHCESGESYPAIV